MMGIKLNAQVIIRNLQNMPEKSLPPTGARKTRRMEQEPEYEDWASARRRAACNAREHTEAGTKAA
jgi:hypothetical protein